MDRRWWWNRFEFEFFLDRFIYGDAGLGLMMSGFVVVIVACVSMEDEMNRWWWWSV